MWIIAAILILGIVGVGGAMYGKGGFGEILATWGIGLFLLLMALLVGVWLTLKWPMLGIPFILVAGLYVVSWMLKD